MKRTFILLIFIAASTGCNSPVVGSFKDMYDIRSEVQKIAHTGEVAVNINNGAYLSVSVINSPFNTKTSKERKDVSDKIARIAYNEFNNRKYLKEIYVVFSSHKRKYLIVDYSSTIEGFTYSPSELITKEKKIPTPAKDENTDRGGTNRDRSNIVKSG